MITPAKINNQLSVILDKRDKKQTSKLDDAKHIQKIEKQFNTLAEKIIANTQVNDEMNDESKRRLYIVKTLESILGQQASSTATFKQLIDKIEEALTIER